MQKGLYLVKVIEIDSEVQDAGYLIMLYGYNAKKLPQKFPRGQQTVFMINTSAVYR